MAKRCHLRPCWSFGITSWTGHRPLTVATRPSRWNEPWPIRRHAAPPIWSWFIAAKAAVAAVAATAHSLSILPTELACAVELHRRRLRLGHTLLSSLIKCGFINLLSSSSSSRNCFSCLLFWRCCTTLLHKFFSPVWQERKEKKKLKLWLFVPFLFTLLRATIYWSKWTTQKR